MALPTIAEVGRLTQDPELRFAASGVAVTSINLAFNKRRFNKDKNQWEDGDVCFLRGSLFKEAAETVAQQLSKGQLVMVKGELFTRNWTDREGQQRSSIELRVNDIALVVREPAVKPGVDAWGTPAPSAAQPGGGVNHEVPPF